MSKSIKIVEETSDSITLEFEGYEHYIVNAIRRKILNAVDVAAVEYIEVLKNTSGLYDEVLAHRLAMVPFKFNKKVLLSKYSKECQENPDSSRCQIKFVLKAKGPGNVYAKDIKVVHEDFEPLIGDILIVKLLDEQEIDIEGAITLGQGKEHAKYIPAVVGMEEVGDGKYRLYVESISALSPKEIVKEALEKLDHELEHVEKNIK